MKLLKIRAYDIEEKRMIQPYATLDGVDLSLNDRLHPSGKIFLMFFSGKLDSDKKEMYEYDTVIAYTNTEFGSVMKEDGIILYNENLAAFIVSIKGKDRWDYLSNFFRLEVNGYELPKLNDRI